MNASQFAEVGQARLPGGSQKRQRNTFLLERFGPPLYLIGVLLVDHALPSSTIAPSFCSLGLMGMSFFLRPQWMLFWGIVYALVIAGAFFDPTFYQYLNHAPLDPKAIPPASFVRTFTFAASASFCTLFSLTLSRFRKSHDELTEILSRFPQAIVTSDLQGKILFCNESAREKLSLQPDQELGSYFELFAPRERKGLLIARYLSRMTHEDSKQFLELENDGKPLSGETLLLDSTGTKILLTIITER